jgi:hypothetical protein
VINFKVTSDDPGISANALRKIAYLEQIQDTIQEQIEVRECLLSLRAEFLSSTSLSKSVKIKTHGTIILPVV